MARNEVIHPSEEKWKDQTPRENLLHQISYQYSYRNQMFQGDQIVFDLDLKQWKTQLIVVMRAWLKANKPYIAESVKQ
eukprot:488756-Ditylum_brightwellii.AAC.1